ncbi:hypothetical protein Nepgr_003056 [Nepenthes gracilis]|uniref:Cytochrome P450 n=1 Tax=Nepenthes gracilis TaxID=150966 RepID=A0AAD3RYU1_NEPGR|nr:hypothetical protein Nepgr_003056 [Nepenthes gracilis]
MEFQSFSLFIFLIFLLQSLLSFLMKRQKPEKLPPCPRKLPLLGNLHQISDSLHLSLHHLANRHGSLMLLQLGSVPTLVVSSAQIIQDIFNHHDLIFFGRPPLYVAKRLFYNFSSISFVPYGEYWREVRKIVVSELLSMKRVQSFKHVRAYEVNKMLNSVIGSQTPVNISKVILSFTNNLICHIAFGKQDDGLHRFHNILYETQQLMGEVNIADFFPWLSWVNKFNGVDARLEKNFKEFDTFFDQVIEEHRDPSRLKLDHREDIIDILLRVQKDQTQSVRLTNCQIKGVLLDIFIAGTDTSAATIVWTIVELIKNSEVMRRAQNEIIDIARGKENIEESDLPKFSYLNLVLKESFRLHPPVPLLVPRETTQACKINGYEIPAKTRILINARAIARDPLYWKDPNSFKPERFFYSSVDFRGHDYELIPFGIGRRSCPGINFAVLTIELALANLLHCFDWKLPHGITREDVDMVEAVGLTVHKKTPLLLVATPRPR